MDKKHYSLEMRENSKLTRAFQIIFGILCIAIAIYWLIYNFKSVQSDRTLWITVAFLTGFGGWLIWSGSGHAYRYIEFYGESIRLRKNSFLPASVIEASGIEKVEVYPLKVVVKLKSSATILLRFGVTDVEKIESIKDEFTLFASRNDIGFELKNEI